MKGSHSPLASYLCPNDVQAVGGSSRRERPLKGQNCSKSLQTQFFSTNPYKVVYNFNYYYYYFYSERFCGKPTGGTPGPNSMKLCMSTGQSLKVCISLIGPIWPNSLGPRGSTGTKLSTKFNMGKNWKMVIETCNFVYRFTMTSGTRKSIRVTL